MEPIKLYSNKLIAGFVFLCGVFILSMAVSYEYPAQMIMGPMFVLLGVLLFVIPTIVITKNEIQMRNLFGMTLKRYSYNSDNVRVEGRKLYIDNKKVRLGAGGAMHGPDVNRAFLHFDSVQSKANDK